MNWSAILGAIHAVASVTETVLGNIPLDPTAKNELHTALTSAKDVLADAKQAASQVAEGEVLPAVESAGTAVVEGAEGVAEAAAVVPQITPGEVVGAVLSAIESNLPSLIENAIASVTASKAVNPAPSAGA